MVSVSIYISYHIMKHLLILIWLVVIHQTEADLVDEDEGLFEDDTNVPEEEGNTELPLELNSEETTSKIVDSLSSPMSGLSTEESTISPFPEAVQITTLTTSSSSTDASVGEEETGKSTVVYVFVGIIIGVLTFSTMFFIHRRYCQAFSFH